MTRSGVAIAATILLLASAARAQSESAWNRGRLADAPEAERTTLSRFLAADTWAQQALGIVRLERYSCPESRELLHELVRDDRWQVRAFAISTLGRRRDTPPEGWLNREEDPRVLRTALRHRFEIDRERLGRGIRFLTKQSDLVQKMLGVELAVTVQDDADLQKLARATLRTIVLRMSRQEAGVLSPRLAMITGAWDVRTPQRWQRWLRKVGRDFTMHPVHFVPEPGVVVPFTFLAQLEPAQFASLRDYVDELGERSVDLAICIDTTASMYGELAAAQGGIDDLMLFVGDVIAELRVAIVAYRDRGNRYRTRYWDFTADIDAARASLWQLTASEGGDRPEDVHPAMLQAYTELSWRPDTKKVLVLIGDAPPHVGTGTKCVEMAKTAFDQSELVTHAIQAAGKPVDHFDAIAEAGHGQCLSLEDDDALIPEISGLTIGERFGKELGEFFQMYLAFCR